MTTLQGYRLESFTDAFRRYLPIDLEHRNNPQETAENQHIRSGTPDEPVPHGNTRKPAETLTCSGVPVENPPEAGKGAYEPDAEDIEHEREEREAIKNEPPLDELTEIPPQFDRSDQRKG